MIKRTLIVFAALAFASTTAIAAAPNGATLSKDKRFTSVPQGSTHYSPLQPKKGGVIFSNIGTAYPKGLYFCCYGDTISGPSSPVGGNYAVAIQFTPASDGKVKEIDAAVGWASGTNGATIALYDDNGGVPGTQLASDDVTGLGSSAVAARWPKQRSRLQSRVVRRIGSLSRRVVHLGCVGVELHRSSRSSHCSI